ncbi:ATP-binding cassette domain-containing protein [Limosilactobacillus ingluviei]
MTDPITIQNVTFSYQAHQPVLQITDLTIPRGSFTLLYGPSGSGKSTLLRLLAGLLPKYGGHLNAQAAINLAPQETAMLFQDPSLQFALDTPQHEAEFALENLQVHRHQMRHRIRDAFATVGISNLADRQFATLSGGEKQRAALAVVIAMHRPVILLDEPFASLDAKNRALLLAQLQAQVAAGKTVIIADHDLANYQAVQPQIIRFDRAHQATQLPEAAAQALLTAAAQPIALPTQAARTWPAAIVGRKLVLERPHQRLLDQANCQIPANKITLLTGESGSGKSTLLKCLAKLVPYQGELTLQGRSLQKYRPRQWGRQVGLVFQHAADQFLNVTMAEELALSQAQGRNPYFTPANLTAAIDLLGLTGLADRVVYSLSGGQQKKLQLLVMLMMDQPVLLLDEPFAGLDAASAQAVRQLITACQAVQPATIIVVSHQLAGLAGWVDCHLHLSHQQLQDLAEVRS